MKSKNKPTLKKKTALPKEEAVSTREEFLANLKNVILTAKKPKSSETAGNLGVTSSRWLYLKAYS